MINKLVQHPSVSVRRERERQGVVRLPADVLTPRDLLRGDDLLGIRTLALSRFLLERGDLPRESALRIAAGIERLPPSELEEALRRLGFLPLSGAQDFLYREMVLELSGETISPSDNAQLHLISGHSKDRLDFLHCREMQTKTLSGDPILPVPRRSEGISFVRKFLPSWANALGAAGEANRYFVARDERRLKELRTIGRSVAQIQAAMNQEADNLSVLDIASTIYAIRCQIESNVGGDPHGRQAVRQGFQRELFPAKVRGVVRGAADDLFNKVRRRPSYDQGSFQ